MRKASRRSRDACARRRHFLKGDPVKVLVHRGQDPLWTFRSSDGKEFDDYALTQNGIRWTNKLDEVDAPKK